MLDINRDNTPTFSLNSTLLRDIFAFAKPLGHNEQLDNLNLGFGFLYYGIVRALRPRHVLVIGSGFGFSVVCLGLGIKDNGKGRLTFVDPSFSVLKDGPFKTIGGTGQWSNPDKVNQKRCAVRTLLSSVGVSRPNDMTVGVFMSPFNVHYNRAPLSGRVDFVHYHPPIGSNLHMGAMHLRTLLKRQPHYENSLHIVQNERKVTRISGHYQGEPLACYVVQIAARTVSGIDSYVNPGESVERGAIFGMIRIGSQVDLVVPWRADLRTRVRAGDKVRAGETVLID